MTSLSEEQRQRIEVKRLAALQRKKEREKERLFQQQQSSYSQQSTSSVLKPFSFVSPPVQKNYTRNLQISKVSIYQNRKSSTKDDRDGLPKPISRMDADFVLVSKERFMVIAPYDAQVIDTFKSIPSNSYHPKTKQWNFHIRDHDILVQELHMLRRVNVKSISSKVIKALQENQQVDYTSIDLSRIEPELLRNLMPFQEEGVRFGISKNGRCLLADDMGLGKTIQALGIAHYYKEEWPLFVVAPSSVRYVWLEAIEKWLPSVPLHEIAVITSCKEVDQIKEALIVITSYNFMVRCRDILEKKKFSVFIIDESHYLKSQTSQRSQAAKVLMKKAKRIIMLSGTPALSRPQELFVQLSILSPEQFSSMLIFGIQYCAGKNTPYGWDFSGSSNMSELRALLECCIMIRRIKSDVISQLPSKIRQMVILDPNLIQSRNDEVINCKNKLTEEKMSGLQKRSALLAYYSVTARAKLKAVGEFVAELLEKGKKFICFAHHQLVLDEVCKVINKKNTEYIRIDGKVDSVSRKRLCDKFQLDDECRVAVLSITAANTGITLTAAYLVVFAELYWNPGVLVQAEDRAHRIGQTDSVLVQYLVAKDTADDYLLPLIQSKYSVLNKAGLSKDNCMQTDNIASQSIVIDSTIIKYFEKISDLSSEEENEQLANIDLEEIAPKKTKLSN